MPKDRWGKVRGTPYQDLKEISVKRSGKLPDYWNKKPNPSLIRCRKRKEEQI